jgi:hypothetical protein
MGNPSLSSSLPPSSASSPRAYLVGRTCHFPRGGSFWDLLAPLYRHCTGAINKTTTVTAATLPNYWDDQFSRAESPPPPLSLSLSRIRVF